MLSTGKLNGSDDILAHNKVCPEILFVIGWYTLSEAHR